MDRLKFTKTALLAQSLPKPGKRRTIYDTDIPKLAMRITSAGARTFYVVKRVGASMAWLKLGTFPEMTVEQARIKAHAILGEFASGANPAEARRMIRQQPTFGEMLDEMLTKKRKRDGTPLSERTKKDYQDTARLHLARIAGKKLSDISRDDVKKIHEAVSEKRPRQADKAIAIISSVFGFSTDEGEFSGENPTSLIKMNPTQDRERFVTPSELPYLFEALDESSLGDYFYLSLLTGARRSNVLSMVWSSIDFDTAIWRISKTKNGTSQNVTLSSEAIEILKRRMKDTGDSRFVFPGTGKSGHLVEPKKAWATVLRRASMRRLVDILYAKGKLSDEELEGAGKLILEASVVAKKRYCAMAHKFGVDTEAFDMTDLHIHDLRRTLGSWQAMAGSSLPIIGKSLNHKTPQATAIYARLDLEPVRVSVNKATQAMLLAASVSKMVRN